MSAKRNTAMTAVVFTVLLRDDFNSQSRHCSGDALKNATNRHEDEHCQWEIIEVRCNLPTATIAIRKSKSEFFSQGQRHGPSNEFNGEDHDDDAIDWVQCGTHALCITHEAFLKRPDEHVLDVRQDERNHGKCR